jgi:WhiB family redox-sensing transcriptional regulator
MDIDLPNPLPPDHQEHQWMLEARCRGRTPHDFFPSDGVGVEQARKICADCPVKEPCLEYALAYRIDHGVWGGASERERRRILRRRRLEGVTAAPSSSPS